MGQPLVRSRVLYQAHILQSFVLSEAGSGEKARGGDVGQDVRAIAQIWVWVDDMDWTGLSSFTWSARRSCLSDILPADSGRMP